MQERVPDGRPVQQFSDPAATDAGAAHRTDGVFEWPSQPLATSFGSEPIWISGNILPRIRTDRDYWRNQSTGLANVDEPAASDAKSTEVPRKTSVTDPNEHLVRRQRFAKLR